MIPQSRLVSLAAAGLIAALLAGCAGAPPERPAEAGRKQYSRVFDGGYVLNYEVETRYSSIDKSSCYAFLSGSVSNRSGQTLSRRTAVAFRVYHGDELLFRDYTYLLSNVVPGATAPFEMLQSPLHRGQCPRYDRIEAELNLVILKSNAAP